MADHTRSVLFVCLGNICRSPAAEGVMQQLVNQTDLGDKILVDSAGTAGYHIGELADARMREASSRRGIDLLSRSRKLTPADLELFDLIVAMDRENLADINLLGDQSKGSTKMLSDYLDDQWPDEVPDPYYGGADGFETVLDMLEAACPRILDELSGHLR